MLSPFFLIFFLLALLAVSLILLSQTHESNLTNVSSCSCWGNQIIVIISFINFIVVRILTSLNRHTINVLDLNCMLRGSKTFATDVKFLKNQQNLPTKFIPKYFRQFLKTHQCICCHSLLIFLRHVWLSCWAVRTYFWQQERWFYLVNHITKKHKNRQSCG